ncbi:MAG: N-acetyltransferase [Anaeroplasmataceae bacterium]|nr:N-acetyltransferase [Anaeroplasmataceae bacterium]
MVQVVKVQTKKQKKEFVNFPLKLYKNNPNFVPPLYGDEMALFKKDFIYSDQSESVFYNAYKDGKMVGRISGILQLASNKKWNQKRVRFTRFDSIDDQEVADALFQKVEEWAKEKGMEEVVGPLGYSDMEREGLLIEGFDELATFEEQYNFDYYQRLIENCGYAKEVDWTERKIYFPEEVDERIVNLSTRMMERYNLKVVKAKNTKQLLKRYADKIFHIIDVTYNDLYQTVPCTPKMKKSLVQSFRLIINIKYVAVIVDQEDNVVGFGLCFPSIARAVQKSNGHLTLPAIFRILKAIKKPEILDLGLIGIVPEYQNKGINGIIIANILDMLSKQGIKYAETNLNLETNSSIQNQWKNFKNVLHKRRRSFIKSLD